MSPITVAPVSRRFQKTLPLRAVLIAFVCAPTLALAEAPWRFQFNPATGACEDAAGRTGLNPGVVGPCGDLTRAYLFEADLQGADLRGANLDRAQLGRANLRGADLRGAKLSGAYLYKADLSGADLRGAVFNTSMGGADLFRTELRGAKIDHATTLPMTSDAAQSRGLVFIETPNAPGPALTLKQDR